VETSLTPLDLPRGAETLGVEPWTIYLCQQSWSQGTLPRRTRRFMPSGGRAHPTSTHYTSYTRRDIQAELACVMVIVIGYINLYLSP